MLFLSSYKYLHQGTTENDVVGLQSNFENLNAKVIQNVDVRLTDNIYSTGLNSFTIWPKRSDVSTCLLAYILM